MRESALVIYRDELISVSRGEASTVEFNFDEVWNFRRRLGKQFDPQLLSWVHVHPSGFGTRPSELDHQAARGLCIAFKAVRHFGIICFVDESFKNIKGLVSWYRYDLATERLVPVREHAVEYDPLLVEEEVYMLKALSYGELWQPKSESTDSVQSAATSLSS